MTKTLIIDTSTDAVVIAYGESVTNSVSKSMSQHAFHSENILVVIDEVLSKSGATIKDVDVIGVGIGPGLFTGLRVGITCAHALAQALNINVVYFSSLELVAHSSMNSTDEVIVGKDARRHELYCAHYKTSDIANLVEVDGIKFASNMNRVQDEHLSSPADLVQHVNSSNVELVLDSLETYDELREIDSSVTEFKVDGSSVIDLVVQAHEKEFFADVFNPHVLYLRKSDAELSWGT